MNEKEKAYIAFENLIKKEMGKANLTLEKKVIKKMNAVDNNGNQYATESEIMDAYGYDSITDAERRRLLEALEYKNKRPMLKEDYFILFCERAMSIIAEERGKDYKEQQQREKQDKIAQIEKSGNKPRFCLCCGAIIGEVIGGSIIGTNWYDNHTECAEGHVCKKCMNSCKGHSNCIHRLDD